MISDRRLVIVFGFSLAVMACKGEVSASLGDSADAHVTCVTAAGPTVQCDIAETKGTTAIEVCWDFKVVCKNGTEITVPRSCTTVKDGATVHYTIPAEKIQNAEKCDGEPKATVSNMAIKAAP